MLARHSPNVRACAGPGNGRPAGRDSRRSPAIATQPRCSARRPARAVSTDNRDLVPPPARTTAGRHALCWGASDGRDCTGDDTAASLRDRRAAAMPSSTRRDQTARATGQPDERSATASTGAPSILDEIDRRLLTLLAEDGRRSYA